MGRRRVAPELAVRMERLKEGTNWVLVVLGKEIVGFGVLGKRAAIDAMVVCASWCPGFLPKA